MQCEYILETQEQCTRSADYNANFCKLHNATKKSITPGKSSKGDHQFYPHTNKFSPYEKKFLNTNPLVLNVISKPRCTFKEGGRQCEYASKQNGHCQLHSTTLPRLPSNIYGHILLTLNEVAELLHVVPLTLKRWDRTGKLKAIRINSRGDRRYRRDVIEALVGEL